jgi:hypothetical protein
MSKVVYQYLKLAIIRDAAKYVTAYQDSVANIAWKMFLDFHSIDWHFPGGISSNP